MNVGDMKGGSLVGCKRVEVRCERVARFCNLTSVQNNSSLVKTINHIKTTWLLESQG